MPRMRGVGHRCVPVRRKLAGRVEGSQSVGPQVRQGPGPQQRHGPAELPVQDLQHVGDALGAPQGQAPQGRPAHQDRVGPQAEGPGHVAPPPDSAVQQDRDPPLHRRHHVRKEADSRLGPVQATTSL